MFFHSKVDSLRGSKALFSRMKCNMVILAACFGLLEDLLPLCNIIIFLNVKS
jgi:hypothetical protein